MVTAFRSKQVITAATSIEKGGLSHISSLAHAPIDPETSPGNGFLKLPLPPNTTAVGTKPLITLTFAGVTDHIYIIVSDSEHHEDKNV